MPLPCRCDGRDEGLPVPLSSADILASAISTHTPWQGASHVWSCRDTSRQSTLGMQPLSPRYLPGLVSQTVQNGQGSKPPCNQSQGNRECRCRAAQSLHEVLRYEKGDGLFVFLSRFLVVSLSFFISSFADSPALPRYCRFSSHETDPVPLSRFLPQLFIDFTCHFVVFVLLCSTAISSVTNLVSTMSDVENQSKAATSAAAVPQDHHTDRAVTPTTPVGSLGMEKPVQTVLSKEIGDSSFDDPEPVPHVHLKTYLAVFAVCLIYFAQDFALVGAGSVCVH